VVLSLSLLVITAWFGGRSFSERPRPPVWTEVAPGVWRSPGFPAGYALVAGEQALLFDAPEPAEGLKAAGVKKIDRVLRTHHHRDSCAAAERYLKDGVPVRAAQASADWLEPEGVAKYWKESLPLRGSRTAYLVVPEGLAGVDCSLADGQTIDFH